MSILKATKTRANLYNLIDEIADYHQPIIITEKRNNAVLLSEEDWNAINETLYLVSISSVLDSIKEGLKTDLSECKKEIDW